MLTLQKKLNQLDPKNPILPPVLEQWLQWHVLPYSLGGGGGEAGGEGGGEGEEPKRKRKITGVSFAPAKKGTRPEGYLFSFDVVIRSLVAVNCEAIVCNSHIIFSADVPGVMARSGCVFVEVEGIFLNEEKSQIDIKEVEGGKVSLKVQGEVDVEVIFDRLVKVWVEALWGFHTKVIGKEQVHFCINFFPPFHF